MSEDKAVEILKNAILLEKRGKAFYSQVAQHTSGKAVKQFFEMMANEEAKHIKILSDQFKAYQDKKRFDAGDFAKAPNLEPVDGAIVPANGPKVNIKGLSGSNGSIPGL